MNERVVSYAQNREDVLLAAFFDDSRKGFYVDVGAHDPVDDSVTKYFYDRGWRGINLEPNKRLFEKLRKDRPEDTNLNIGVSDKPGELSLRIYDDGDGLSTFSAEMQQEYSAKKGGITKRFHDETVPVQTLKDIFEKHNVTKIDFLKVDIEGYEYNALVGNDWKKYKPTVLCIEANHVKNDWRPLIESHGYVKIFFDGLNEYYALKEAGFTADNFPYVESIIGRPIVSRKAHDWISELAAKNEVLQATNAKLRNDVREKDQEITRLNVYIFEHTKLRIVVRDFAKALNHSIVVRLDERSTKKKFYPRSRVKIEELSSAKDVYEVVNTLDKQAVYSRPSISQQVSTLFYTLVGKVYKLLKKVLRKAFRVFKKIVKRGKR